MAYSTKKMTDRMIKKLQSKLAKTPSNLTNQKNRIKQQISKLRTEERTRESKRAHAAPKRKSEQFRQPPLTGTSGKTSTAAGSVKRRPGQPSAASKSIPTLRPSRKAKPASVKKPPGAGTGPALEKLQGNRSITEGLVIKDETKRAKPKTKYNALTSSPSRRRPGVRNRARAKWDEGAAKRKKAAAKKPTKKSSLRTVPSRRATAASKAAYKEGVKRQARRRAEAAADKAIHGYRPKKKAPAKKKPAKKKASTKRSYWGVTKSPSRRRK